MSRDQTNDWVRSKINFHVVAQEPLLATVKRRKLTRLRYVTRHESLSETILQGTLESGRRRGRQRKCWMDNTKVWTVHARTAHIGLLQKRLEEDLF